MPTRELPTWTRRTSTSKRAWLCSRDSRPTVCRIRLACPCRKMYTLRRTNLGRSVGRPAHNGVHTRRTRRQGLHHLHSLLATTGTVVGRPNCRTLRCSLSRRIPSISAIACSRRALRGNRVRHARSHRACIKTSSPNARLHQRTAGCRLRRRASTRDWRLTSILHSIARSSLCLLNRVRRCLHRSKTSNAHSSPSLHRVRRRGPTA